MRAGMWALAGLLATMLAGSMAAAEPPAPVAVLVFSRDGTQLLAGQRTKVAVYDVATRKHERDVACAFAKVNALAFSADGRVLLVAGGSPGVSGGLQLIDWPGGSILQTFTNRSDVATGIALNPQGDTIAVSGADHEIALFHFDAVARKAEPWQQLAGHSRSVLAALFGPDGNTLVTASADRSIKVWDAKAGALLRSFSHHTDIVHCLALRPDTVTVGEAHPFACASGSDDRTVRVWQPGIGRMVRIVRRHEGAVYALAYSRDGTRLFSAGKEGVIRMIDADSDDILQQWPAHADWIYSLAVSPDGKTLASGDWEGHVKLWTLESPVGRLIGDLK